MSNTNDTALPEGIPDPLRIRPSKPHWMEDEYLRAREIDMLATDLFVRRMSEDARSRPSIEQAEATASICFSIAQAFDRARIARIARLRSEAIANKTEVQP